MSSVFSFMKLGLFFSIMTLVLSSSLHAQVITEPDVNSWDEPGFLMVVAGLGSVVAIILITIFYENRRKKQREPS